ncbi:MAG: glycosyltransferase family 2 protein [Anaerolinea sp.]|nr:glycosyltransferase family 2 protein [Anaerolinea sp.]
MASTGEPELTAPVSTVVLTFNEEPNIDACLRSVHGWCHEIFVLDSGSTDQTVAICQRYTDKIFVHSYTDHASQINWALSNLPLACDWILLLDADNVVSELLKWEVEQALADDDPRIAGYYSRHLHMFRNRPVRGLKSHWLRLIRRARTRIDQCELVDFRWILDGETRILSGAIIESNQKENDIDFWIDKHQKFSSRMAIEEVLRNSGILKWSSELRPRLYGNPDERMLWFKDRWYRMPLYVRPILYFFYRYFLRLGFLDGVDGFIFNFLQAFWFRLIVDIKIAELRRRLTCGELSLTQLAESFAHDF